MDYGEMVHERNRLERELTRKSGYTAAMPASNLNSFARTTNQSAGWAGYTIAFVCLLLGPISLSQAQTPNATALEVEQGRSILKELDRDPDTCRAGLNSIEIGNAKTFLEAVMSQGVQARSESDRSDMDRAGKCLSEYYASRGDWSIAAENADQLGQLDLYLRRLPQALEADLMSLRYWRKSSHQEGLFLTWSAIAEVHLEANRPREAEEALRQSAATIALPGSFLPAGLFLVRTDAMADKQVPGVLDLLYRFENAAGAPSASKDWHAFASLTRAFILVAENRFAELPDMVRGAALTASPLAAREAIVPFGSMVLLKCVRAMDRLSLTEGEAVLRKLEDPIPGVDPVIVERAREAFKLMLPALGCVTTQGLSSSRSLPGSDSRQELHER